MPFKYSAAVLALAATVATPAVGWAFTGVGGCNSLPEYYRALGTLQGNMESACNMTIAQARAIVAAYDGPAAVLPPVAPPTRSHERRHHMRKQAP